MMCMYMYLYVYMHVQMYTCISVDVHVCSVPFLRRGGVGGR